MLCPGRHHPRKRGIQYSRGDSEIIPTAAAIDSLRHPEVRAKRASKDGNTHGLAVILRGAPKERGHLRMTVIVWCCWYRSRKLRVPRLRLLVLLICPSGAVRDLMSGPLSSPRIQNISVFPKCKSDVYLAPSRTP